MPSATINPALVQVGAGILRIAPLGTAIPADPANGALPAYAAAWREVGGTTEGSVFNVELSTDDIFLAESIDRVKTGVTQRTLSVGFAMAELSAMNLKYAFNGADSTVTTGTAAAPRSHVKIALPDIGTEVRRMLAWDSEDGTERMVFPVVFQGGATEMPRKKYPDLTQIPVVFSIEKPATGAIIDWWLANSRVGTGFTINPA